MLPQLGHPEWLQRIVKQADIQSDNDSPEDIYIHLYQDIALGTTASIVEPFVGQITITEDEACSCKAHLKQADGTWSPICPQACCSSESPSRQIIDDQPG